MSSTLRNPGRALVVIGTLKHMGGAERQALYLVEHLAGLTECEVEVLAFEEGEALRPFLKALAVPVHVVPYYFKWPAAKRGLALAHLAWVLRTQIKPDALLPFVSIHSKAIGQIWRWTGASFCWWNQQDEGRDLFGTPTEARVLRDVSCITSNSEAGRRFLVETFGLDPAEVLVYNNGTPLPAPAATRSGWREERGLSDRPLVSMIANVTRFKDHETLLDAWNLVQEEWKGGEMPVLLLAGHHRERDTVSRLKRQAFDLGLSSRDVHFLGPVQDVMPLIAASDVVVHSSLTEGCPNAVCEAMALGRPVVATDIPGCRQALGDASEPWLVPERDPRALADAVLTMLNDPELQRETGAYNRMRIATEFTIAGMNEFFQRLVEAGLSQPLGAPECAPG